ncbi:MAG TPA: hypothetical protein VER77_07195 [Candidatus Dormibacteraeota bacterium]|nr:hypothetical protein [Candidatus Dormibacteraeota bacterium]
MPQTSTKQSAVLVTEASEVAHLPRVERARRRIGERYYDRPEVRRTLASLILRRMRRTGTK